MSDINLEENRRLGGEAVKKKYGRDHFVDMGKKGHKARMAKYGTDYYKRIGRISAEKRKAKKQSEVKAEDGLLSKLFGIKK